MEIWIQIERDGILPGERSWEEAGRRRRRREKKSLDTRRDKYMYTSRQVTIIYGNKIKPQGRPREKLGIEETARQGVQNDRLPRLGSFRVSPPRSVFENEARYVILFITAKCKRWPRKGAERYINTNGQICWSAFVSRARENVRAIGKLPSDDERAEAFNVGEQDGID